MYYKIVSATIMNYTNQSSKLNETIPNNIYKTIYEHPVRDTLVIVVPLTVIYSAIFLTGVIGNIITCIVISRNKSMHTATNYYLFSLAVSDLLLLISGKYI